MARANPYQPAINAGEITPYLWARTDFRKYGFAGEIVENMIPLAEGALRRRAGTRYVAEVKTSTDKCRIKRFQFNDEQAYVLELGNTYMRFCRYQAQIAVANTDAAIANGTFDTGITSWTSRSDPGGSIAHDDGNHRLSIVGDGSAYGWAEQSVAVSSTYQNVEHVLRFRTYGAPGDTVLLRIGLTSKGGEIVSDRKMPTGFHSVAFTPGATTFYVQFRHKTDKTLGVDDVSLIDNAPVEIATPWSTADLAALNGPQSADELYFFHRSYPTYRLDRRGHTTWSLVEVAWQDGPYLTFNSGSSTSTTIQPAATTGYGVSFTASATTDINDGDGFKSTDVGRAIRITSSTTTTDWGWGVIAEYRSPTQVLVDIKRTLPGTEARPAWGLGSWSATTGYPSVGTFYEQRLVAAASTKEPQTLWMSQTSDFENMSPDSVNSGTGKWDGTVEDDDAIVWTISADNVNVIRWMSPGEDTLVIGTSAAEWIPKSQGAVLTPSDMSVRVQTTHGSAAIGPVRVGHAVLFVQRAGRKIREFAYDFNTNGYLAQDMTRLASHISVGGIAEMDFAEEPDSSVIAIRADGQLLNMTYRREEDVVGFSRFKLGGSFGTTAWGIVESIAVIPGADGSGQVADSTDRDEVWVAVKRTINGQTRRYIEVFERNFEHDVHDKTDAYYADSLITYDGTAATTITGLGHLEGQAVTILADGAIITGKTVSGGSVTLDVAASTVQIGLAFTHKFKGLKWEAGAVIGTAVGKIKRIVAMTFVLLDAAIVKYGSGESKLKTRDFRSYTDVMDGVPELFSGEANVSWDGTWERDTRVYVEDDSPTPFVLLAIAPELDTRDLR